jgi:hypothetical protein
MDRDAFDGLVRLLAERPSRRAALGTLLGVGSVGALGAAAKPKKKKRKKRKKPAPTVAKRSAFSTGWTHVAGTTSGILFYEADTGLVLSGRFVDGNFTLGNSLGDEPGWTHVVGAGRSLFCYRASDGVAASGLIDDQGKFVQVAAPAVRYTTNWTMFAGTRSGRYPWYKGGALSPSRLTDDGREGGGCFEQIQGGAWTHFVGAGFNTFLLYNSVSGAAKTARIDDVGPCDFGGRSYTWTLLDDHAFAQGWTHAAGTFAGGVAFYRAGDGFGGVGFLDADGGWRQTGNPSFGAGWSHVTGAGSSGLLFYDDATGKAMGGVLGADGVWRTTTTYG